jgi:hypothetical protein
VREQGWYVDPYALHSWRWYSDGTPTSLVRDNGAESHDAPPPGPPPAQPVAAAQAHADASDMKRADDAVTGGPPYDGERGLQFVI